LLLESSTVTANRVLVDGVEYYVGVTAGSLACHGFAYKPGVMVGWSHMTCTTLWYRV